MQNGGYLEPIILKSPNGEEHFLIKNFYLKILCRASQSKAWIVEFVFVNSFLSVMR